MTNNLNKHEFKIVTLTSDFGPPHGFASFGDYYGANRPHFWDRYESVIVRDDQRVLRQRRYAEEEE